MSRYSESGRALWRRTLSTSFEKGLVVSVASDDHGVVVGVQGSGTFDSVVHDGEFRALDPEGEPSSAGWWMVTLIILAILVWYWVAGRPHY